MKRALLLLFTTLFCMIGYSQVELFNPIQSPTTVGLAAQDFETANDQYDCMVADDFTVPSGETWYLDSLYIGGQYSAGATATSGLIIHIYEDDAGDIGPLVFSDTINNNLDFYGDGDLRPYWETPIEISSGTYWLALQARKDFGGGGGQWYWTREGSLTGYLPKWQNPNNGFGSGCTSWITSQNCAPLNFTDSGHIFTMYGCYGPTKPLYPGGYDTLLCAGSVPFVPITADTQGSQTNVTYTWSTGETTMSINVDSTATYTVYGVDTVTQCGMRQEIEVEFIDVTQPNLFDTTVCASSLPFVYQAPAAGCNNCINVWPDSSSGAFYGANQPGTVTLTIMDTVSGCFKSDDGILTVDFGEVTIQPGLLIDVCEGSEVGVSTLETLSNYLWQFNDGINWVTISSADTAEVSATGTLAVSGTTGNNCQGKDTAFVTLRPLPEPEITGEGQGNGDVKLQGTPGYQEYDWSNGGSGANITVSNNGLYTLTVTDEYGCQGSTFFNVINVGLNEVMSNQVSFYPNPTKSIVTFKFADQWAGETDVSVYDVLGRKIMQFNKVSPNHVIDFGAFENGQYLIKYSTPDGDGRSTIVLQK
ncbi:MAG: T9SS type A sorting domain-containing protein [Salibacteraceae bacterium]